MPPVVLMNSGFFTEYSEIYKVLFFFLDKVIEVVEMTYMLKGRDEATRLDEQSESDHFSLESELSGISFLPGTHLMDAGCGSGVLCRYLEKNAPDCIIHGTDLSETSLSHARSHCLSTNTRFYKHDFLQKPFDQKYDFILNRFVAHHLNENEFFTASRNFYESLKPGGEICIIDLDSLFLNLGTKNKKLLDFMERINSYFHGNLKLARLIPSILKDCGFHKISWRIEVMDFQQKAKEDEVLQWKERFESALDFYVSFFNREDEARNFMKLYLDEAKREDVPLFYNKFIIRALKHTQHT